MFGGLICMSNVLGGWPSIFFITGLFGVIWCVLWTLLVSDTPQTQKCISIEEKLYIMEKTAEHSFKAKQKKVNYRIYRYKNYLYIGL